MTESNEQDLTPDPSNFNQQIIEEFRANGGKVGGMFAGAPMLLLTTTGARSGHPRTAPLVYTTDGDRLAIIASKGGARPTPTGSTICAPTPR